MEYEAVVNGHSGLMPSNLITFAHFSVSPETNFANPSGLSRRMTTPTPLQGRQLERTIGEEAAGNINGGIGAQVFGPY